VYDGVIFEAKLYQLLGDAEPVELGSGRIENNLTVFTATSLGGVYLVTGTIELAQEGEGEFLGVSTVRNPIKVFTEAGLYQVTLEVTDSLGEKSEQTELITVSASLQLVEPSAVLEPEELEIEREELDLPPAIPVPEIVPDEPGGFSYFWLIFIVLIIIAVGAVVFIVIRTVKQRQEELGGQPPTTGAVPKDEEIVKPEVVEAPPEAEEAVKPAAVEPKPAEKPAQKKTEAPKEKKPEDKDKGDKPASGSGGGSTAKDASSGEDAPRSGDDKPKGGDGPIPDWLKG